MSDHKKLSAKHKQVARLLVGGHSQTEVARLMSINKSTVCRLVRDPAVAQEIERLQNIADINATSCVPGIPEALQEGAARGIEVLLKILDDERDSVEMLKLKSNAAYELLSRAGYGEVKQFKVEQASSPSYLTPEEIEEIKRRAIENGLKVEH